MLHFMKCAQAGCDNARSIGGDYCKEHEPRCLESFVADRPAASQGALRDEILKPSFCGVAGHFAFQQNGSSCLICQREYRLVSIALRLLRGGNVEFCDKAEIEAVRRVIEREGASQPPQELDGLREALEEIVAVASGERQVAVDDTEGMEWIDKRARAALTRGEVGRGF